MRRTINCIILLFTIVITGASQDAPISFSDPVEGWEFSNIPYNKALIDSLEQKISSGDFPLINGIVVINKGKIQIEKYFNLEDRWQLHDPRSVGKTFASAVLGIALEEGYIKNLDQTLDEFYTLKNYEHYSAKKAEVKLRHLLTMSSAFDGNDNDYDSPGNEENMYPKDDWVKWTLNLPMAKDRTSGEAWNYFTAGVVLLGDILHQSVPGGLEMYAHEKLFAPLGIDRYYWMKTPQGVANTAGGIRMTALDFARFGQLYQNKGRWNGLQIIPEDWVKASFSKHIATTSPPNQYGYLWWNRSYTVGNSEHEFFYCTGNGGNKIYVSQEQDLVIVVTASAYGRRYMHSQVDQIMQDYLLPAVLQARSKLLPESSKWRP